MTAGWRVVPGRPAPRPRKRDGGRSLQTFARNHLHGVGLPAWATRDSGVAMRCIRLMKEHAEARLSARTRGARFRETNQIAKTVNSILWLQGTTEV